MGATGAAFSGLLLNGCTGRTGSAMTAPAAFTDYGPLVPDPAGMLDLPRGFT